MRISPIYFCFLFLILSCYGATNIILKKHENSFEARIPYKECDSRLDIQEEIHFNSVQNLNNLSFSAAYTSIDTYHASVNDTIAKDSIRYHFAKRIKKLINFSFPNIEIINDSLILKKNNPFIQRNSNIIRNKKRNITSSINNLTQKSFQSNKQLFIEISSFYFDNEFNNRVNIFIFNTIESKLLYLNKINYKCDIRDYDSLEKVVSYGLLKLKQNFE